MNFDILLSQVAAVTGNWTDSALRAQALVELQSVQRELEHAPHLPWFLWREQSFAVSASATATNLPTGFIRFDQDYSYVRQVYEDATVFVHPLSLEKFQEYAQGQTAADTIAAYTLTSTQILTSPPVAVEVTLYMNAAFADTTPADSATTNLWATHAEDVLKYRTASRVAGTYLQDFDLESRLEQRAAAAWDVLKKFSQARMLEWQDAVKGDD